MLYHRMHPTHSFLPTILKSFLKRRESPIAPLKLPIDSAGVHRATTFGAA